MSRLSIGKAISIAVLGAAAMAVVVSAQAGGTRSQDGIDQLLAEVRAMRAELSQMARASMRMQMLLARLSLQDQRITALTRQAAGLQDQLASTTQEQAGLAGHLEQMISATQNAAIPESQRREAELEISGIQSRVLKLQQEEQRLQNELGRVSALLADEQARWNDFNTQLDKLEQSLQPPK
jgi:chromosome segregation ATPase